MKEYGSSTYGDVIAPIYDELYPSAEPEALDLVAALAGDGPVLELGIGTGRFALPLAERGLRVEGADASAAMVRRLRSKPGGADIPVHICDIAELPGGIGPYSLVFCVFNTFFGLLTAQAQQACLRSAAGLLLPGGRLLLELFVPDLGRFDRGQCVRALEVRGDAVALEVSRFDPPTQVVSSQRVYLSDRGVRLYPVAVRLAWPAEVDLMAAGAGLRLEDRWSGWDRGAFGPSSTRHISVYRPGS